MISGFSLAPNTTGELLMHHNLTLPVDVVGSMEEAVSKIRNMSRGAELILQLQQKKDKDIEYMPSTADQRVLIRANTTVFIDGRGRKANLNRLEFEVEKCGVLYLYNLQLSSGKVAHVCLMVVTLGQGFAAGVHCQRRARTWMGCPARV